MTFVQKALDEVSGPTVSAVYEVPGATRFAVQTVRTGAATYGVHLQGSIDGVTWASLATATESDPYVGYGLAPTEDRLVRFVRLNAVNELGNDTLTAHLMAV